jgi:hypothetical protein
VIDVDKNWGLDSANDLQLVSGSTAAAQRLELALGTNQGEYRFDQSIGMPWLFSILGKRSDNAAARQLISEVLRRDNEVAAIGEIRADFDSVARRMSYVVSVRLVDGVDISVATP